MMLSRSGRQAAPSRSHHRAAASAGNPRVSVLCAALPAQRIEKRDADDTGDSRGGERTLPGELLDLVGGRLRLFGDGSEQLLQFAGQLIEQAVALEPTVAGDVA